MLHVLDSIGDKCQAELVPFLEESFNMMFYAKEYKTSEKYWEIIKKCPQVKDGEWIRKFEYDEKNHYLNVKSTKLTEVKK